MEQYWLGTEHEQLVPGADGVTYTPSGAQHAVDPHTVPADLDLAYALCGTAVRLWRDLAFDPATSLAHDDCSHRVKLANE